MTAFRYAADTGSLTELQTLSTLPEGFDRRQQLRRGADRAVGPVPLRLQSRPQLIVIYAIDPAEGTLTLVGHESTRGETPRNFEIGPTGDFLAAANQDSNNVVMFRVDPATGKLTATGNIVEAGTPICVRFM